MEDRTPARQLLEAITALQASTDPAEQAVHGHELQETMNAAQASVRAITDAAVARLRKTKSLTEVAALLGVSAQRVSQMATGKHGSGRRPPSVIYAFRVLGAEPGPWHGYTDALPDGDYQTGTLAFDPAERSPFAGQRLEVRYGPVADEHLPPLLYTYTTVNGRRLRPTAAVQQELFAVPACTPAGSRPEATA